MMTNLPLLYDMNKSDEESINAIQYILSVLQCIVDDCCKLNLFTEN
jgi:hypothetical protein